MKMGSDGPIFNAEDKIMSGWVNVGQYDGYQSLGLCWSTRDKAIYNASCRVVYRIHVEMKERSDNARDSF